MKFGQVLLSRRDNDGIDTQEETSKYYHYKLAPIGSSGLQQVKIGETPVFQKTIYSSEDILEFILEQKVTSVTINGETVEDIVPITIKNLLPNQSNRVGIQAVPGTKLCINGELIRVGITGTYEINFDMEEGVEFVGVLDDYDDYFIMDYRYDDNKTTTTDNTGTGEGGEE